MQYSYSRVSCFENCPYQFKLRYIDKLKTVAPQDADNALIIGSAMHNGIETNEYKAVDWYFKQYYCITDAHINEAIKLEILIKKAKKLIYDNAIFEYEIDTSSFHGFVDMMVKNDDGTVNIYDFKYSNNIDRYMETGQLHIYKHYLEKYCNIKVKSMGFIFIPKTMIRQKKTEELYHFRRRLLHTLAEMECKLVKVPFDEAKVTKYINAIQEIECTEIFTKNTTKLCDWCNYKIKCEERLDYMLLPKNEKKIPETNLTPDMWIYGDSYSGKTVFMDSFNSVLMLNTDGNIDHITSPVLRIADAIETEGRITKRKMAWLVFCEAISELEKKENDYKTIVLDLVEDLYEHCRLYIYDKYGVEHEQDLGYGKGWDLVRTEFLSKVKRLKNCDYQLVYISKVSISEITKKSGDKITTIKPNINDKVANVLAGTVDLTARVVADENERFLTFKTSPYIFGGSRYDFGTDKIPLNKDEFIKVLTESQLKSDEATKKIVENVTTEPTDKDSKTQSINEKPARKKREVK